MTDRRSLSAVWFGLLVLALTRGVAALTPSMWAWGLNVGRFLSPALSWSLWSLSLLPLLPSVGTGLASRLGKLGDWLMSKPRIWWIAAMAGYLFAWSLPDRTWITGDFMLRQGSAETGRFANTFYQAMPMETLLDGIVPQYFGALALRVIGAGAAGGLAVVSLSLARAWGLTGGAAMTSAGMIFFGGYLTAFTGLGKPAAPMSLLVAVVTFGSTRLATSTGGAALLGLGLSAALLTHRSAILLAPMWALALWLASRGQHPLPRGSRTRLLIAGLPPVLVALALAPMIWRIVQTHDVPHHLLSPELAQAGVLGAAFAPIHLLDIGNVLLLYSPGIVIALMILITGGLGELGGRPLWLLAALVAPFTIPLLFAHPMQGIFRDLDAFVPVGVAFALLSAYVVGTSLQRQRLPTWIGPGVLVAAVVPCLQWMLHFHDPDYGMQRVRAWALEPPERTTVERAHLWDGIALRAFRLEQWDEAVEASEHYAAAAPYEASLLRLAIARTYAHDYVGAETLYVRLTDQYPNDPLVWLGLGGVAVRLGDRPRSEAAMAKLRQYAPGSPEVQAMRRHLQIFPVVWPSAADGAAGAQPQASPSGPP